MKILNIIKTVGYSEKCISIQNVEGSSIQITQNDLGETVFVQLKSILQNTNLSKELLETILFTLIDLKKLKDNHNQLTETNNQLYNDTIEFYKKELSIKNNHIEELTEISKNLSKEVNDKKEGNQENIEGVEKLQEELKENQLMIKSLENEVERLNKELVDETDKIDKKELINNQKLINTQNRKIKLLLNKISELEVEVKKEFEKDMLPENVKALQLLKTGKNSDALAILDSQSIRNDEIIRLRKWQRIEIAYKLPIARQQLLRANLFVLDLNISEAEKDYLRSIDTYPFFGNLYQAGLFYYELGENQRANEYLELALAKIPENSLQRAEAFLKLGKLYENVGDYELSLKNYLIAEEEYSNLYTTYCDNEKTINELFSTYKGIVEAYSTLYQFDKALDYANKGVEIVSKLNQTRNIYYKQQSNCLGLVANIYEKQNRFKEAEEFYNEAINLIKEDTNTQHTDKKQVLGALLIKLGILYNMHIDKNKAVTILNEAKEIYTNSNEKKDNIQLFVTLVYLANSLDINLPDESKLAYKYIDKSIRLFDELQPSLNSKETIDLIGYFNLIGFFYLNSNNYTQSYSAFIKVATYYRLINTDSYGGVLNNLGLLQLNQNNKEGYTNLVLAHSIFEKQGLSSNYLTIILNLASIFWSYRQYSGAISNWSKYIYTLKKQTSLKRTIHFYDTVLNIAITYLVKNSFQNAINTLSEFSEILANDFRQETKISNYYYSVISEIRKKISDKSINEELHKFQNNIKDNIINRYIKPIVIYLVPGAIDINSFEMDSAGFDLIEAYQKENELFFRKGNILFVDKKYEKAIEYYDTFIKNATTNKNSEKVVEAYIKRGYCYSRKETICLTIQIQPAFDNYNKAISIIENHFNGHQEIHRYYLLCLLYIQEEYAKTANKGWLRFFSKYSNNKVKETFLKAKEFTVNKELDIGAQEILNEMKRIVILYNGKKSIKN